MESSQALIQTVGELAVVLQGTELDPQQRQALTDLVHENELDHDESIPDWLLELLEQVRDRKPTGEWIKFTLPGLGSSDILNFIQELDQVLPMQFENQEETWLLTFPSITLEAVISFEGYCYKVSPIGTTWADEE
jgi:hypothetical protein